MIRNRLLNSEELFLLVREKITETEPNADGLLAKLADSQLQASKCD